MKAPLKTQLIAAIVIPLAIGAAIALLVTARLAQSVRFYEDLLHEEVADQLTARHMQELFKLQVQEWKNVLLRGQNPLDLEQHWAGMLESEQQVAHMAQSLLHSNDQALRVMVHNFALAHAQLGATYRRVLEVFKAGGARDPFRADREVRGIDREPTQDIDEMVGHLAMRVNARSAALHASFAFERLLVFGAILLVFVYAGSALYVILRRMQKAEAGAGAAQRLETIGRIAGGVAHHYNNLLMVISGNAEVLLPLHPPEAPGHRAATAIVTASKRGAELTQGLLASASRAPVRLVKTDLNALVERQEAKLREILGPGIKVKFSLQTGLWKTRTDAEQLAHALQEMAANCAAAMPDGGELTVSTANISADAEWAAQHTDARPGNYVRLEFHDNGQGIAPEIIDHIFEPFYSTREVGQGNGLGLSTVYGLVKQSGGFALAESSLNRGTRISLCLPRYAGSKPELA